VISELTLKERIPNLKIDKIIEKPIPLERLKKEVEYLIKNQELIAFLYQFLIIKIKFLKYKTFFLEKRIKKMFLITKMDYI
jgi:hypothetical protein